MNIKVINIVILFLLLSLLSFSQQITNIHFEQEGKQIHIYYDLEGEGFFNVKVYCSEDNGNTWGKQLEKVKGAVGENQIPEKNKMIIWDVLQEREELSGNLRFKVDVHYEGEIIEAEIFTVADVMPEFPGGMGKLMAYLGNNIKYPPFAKKENIQGRVFINFVVEPNGSISNVKVLRGIGYGCDEEAIRVVESMPNWKPGMQRGKPIRVSYNLPVKFTLTQK